MSKWCGDENCLQCADKEPDPYVHLPRADYDALCEQNRVLAREYTRLFNLAKPIATLLQDLKIIPIGCSREQELAWKMAVKNFRHYQQGYEASVAMEAALTATSQEVL
mgnify:CR=1 FL=1|jgi:hypothetical protein